MDTQTSSDQTRLSKNSAIAVAVASSIAAAILFVFIVHVISGMRRGMTLIGIVKFRKGSTIPDTNCRDGRPGFTRRSTVWSPPHPSLMKSPRRQEDMPPLPLYDTRNPQDRDAWYRQYWEKRAGSSTPAKRIASWYRMNAPGESVNAMPEMVHLNNGPVEAVEQQPTDSTSGRCTPARSKTTTISVRDVSIAEEQSDRGKRTRWSWTNSEAPSTPALRLGREETRTSWRWTNSDAPSTPGFEVGRSERSLSNSSLRCQPKTSDCGVQMGSINEDGTHLLVSHVTRPKSTYTGSSRHSHRSGGLRTFFAN